jgi:hypothetical protein
MIDDMQTNFESFFRKGIPTGKHEGRRPEEGRKGY